MSNLRFMRTFVAVARLGSFSEAAEHVGLSQAAVSLQMRALEQEFGRELFDRCGRLALLNTAGQELLPEIKKLLEMYERIKQPNPPDGQFQGQLTIGAIVSCMNILAQIVSQLKTEHPGLGIRLVSGKSSELAQKLEHGDVDAAFVVNMGKRTASVRWSLLQHEPVRLIVAASVEGDDPREILAHHPFLRFDRTQHTGRQIDRVLQKLGVTPDDFLELNAIEQILSLVRDEVGVTILPLLHTVDWSVGSDLRVLALPGKLGSLTRDVGLIEPRGSRQQKITRAILERYKHSLGMKGLIR
ncbi:LysR substrate-binding domain-containing protein [Allopusillimonas ginsengisoli]|uniref:LysR substrate-binding domain-containing protein n=1 Tax=Allopusillimonas ginsengisoli TaxID=453575 RepID=UPI0010202BD9|nr:LysR substrate-binding domain-containing protein [Allopusillimonas ginsengisoli]TEA79874.1 LysR family transcriptional regulator [Allopusillimonas ginsengisoli]